MLKDVSELLQRATLREELVTGILFLAFPWSKSSACITKGQIPLDQIGIGILRMLTDVLKSHGRLYSGIMGEP